MTPWMDWLWVHLGEHEIPGFNQDNPFIIDLFKNTSYHADHDETPWCAATACTALEETGTKSPRNAAAVSFVDYGEECELQPGCIVVFQWANGKHHVTFCLQVSNDQYVACLGGNQDNRIEVKEYERKYIIATRWPVAA